MTPRDRLHIDRGDHWESDGQRIDKPSHPPFIEADAAALKPKCFAPLNSHWFYMEGKPTLGVDKNGAVDVGVLPGDIKMVKQALCGWERPNDRKAHPINGEVHCAECLLRQIEISTGIDLSHHRSNE